MGALTTLLIARHGEIQANVDKRWHGSTDSELTTTGKAQAAKLAHYLVREGVALDAIYTSPLKRAQQTAAPVAGAFALQPVVMNELQEFGIGVLENLGYTELLERERFYERIEQDIEYAPKGGESVANVGRRMRHALAQITGRHAGESVLMVSHGAAIAILLTELFEGRYFPFDTWHSSNTGLSQLLCGEQVELGFFDQTLHLRMVDDPLEVEAESR